MGKAMKDFFTKGRRATDAMNKHIQQNLPIAADFNRCEQY